MTKWRYVTKAWQGETGEGWQDRPTTTVFEAEDGPVETGLLDQNGTPLFRMVERNPIGFCLERPRYRVKAGSSKS